MGVGFLVAVGAVREGLVEGVAMSLTGRVRRGEERAFLPCECGCGRVVEGVVRRLGKEGGRPCRFVACEGCKRYAFN